MVYFASYDENDRVDSDYIVFVKDQMKLECYQTVAYSSVQELISSIN